MSRLKKLFLSVLVLFTTQIYAATIIWTGGVDDDWNTVSNWDTGTFPTASDDVIIPSTSSTNFNAARITSGEEVNVSLGFDVSKDGSYNLNIEELINIPMGYTVWLNDAITGNSYNLSFETNIDFTSEAASNDARFSLTFEPSTVLILDEYGVNNLAILSGNKSGLKISHSSSVQQVSVYDINGKIMLNEKLKFTNNQLEINIPLAANQVYILRVADEAIKFKLR